MNDTVDGFREAASQWLADGAAYAADPVRALRAFGLPQAMAEATPGEQAAISMAVGLAMGEALAKGPLVEAVAAEICGLVRDGRTTLAALDPQDPRVASMPQQVPYADLAQCLLFDVGALGAPRLAYIDVSTLRDLQRVPQVDGTTLGLCDLRAHASTEEALGGTRALAAATQVRDLLLLSTSARLIGVGARCLRIAREHLSTRTQFGKALASFQVLQHGVVDAHIDITLARSLLERVVEDWTIATQRRALLLALKSHASATARNTCRMGVQWMGAMGFTDEGPAGPCLKHALVLAARYGGEARSRRTYRNDPIDLFA